MSRRVFRIGLLLPAFLLLATVAAGKRQGRADPFNHPRHAKLFVNCATCHAGAERDGSAMLPEATSCVACHDGTVERRTEWQPRSGPRVSNLRFDHRRHAAERRAEGDTTETCSDCHAERGSPWMQVRGPTAAQCVGCHLPEATNHLTVPAGACVTCHTPLAQATTLPRERVALFPAPPDHRAPGFLLALGHGAAAQPAGGGAQVAQSCATCHARDFCAACHVNAPETATIQALEADPRSLALRHELKPPATHSAANFESKHGAQAGRTGASCSTCHTQESCASCHRAGAPIAALALYRAGPGRGDGARTTRRAPSNHTPEWTERHGPAASASMRTCTSCHTRDSCLSCHRPDPARRGGYHPASYLTRHPADAWTRSSSCSDCHNQGEFCQTCHLQSGLSAQRTLLGPAGYHDGNRQFALGHGQAARQSLESCVSCHIERDCLTCHSVVGGRGYSPHGPGFNSERLLKKNPQLCIACHGRTIPRR